MIDTEAMYYCVGDRTAIGIMRPHDEHAGAPFVQLRTGLHHVCLRARSREDVDALHAFLVELGATVVHPPQEDAWAPGHYSVLFEDPDGIRLEMNHVPGRGLLESKDQGPRTRRALA